MGFYLDELPLNEEEKEKIINLGVNRPIALLSMMQAEPNSFQNFLGRGKFKNIIRQLYLMLSDKERQILENTPVREIKLGAIVGKSAPHLPKTNYDISERDELFEELSYWQNKKNSSLEAEEKIKDLTEKLNNLFAQDK